MHYYDELTPDTIVACVEAAGFTCDLRLVALNSYENRVYQVGIEDDAPLIAKFYRDARWNDEQILEEHAFALELQDAEISVVAPMVIEGTTLFKADKYRFALFPRRGGYPPEFDNLNNLLILGRTLGRIHSIGASQPFKYRTSLNPIERMTSAREFCLEHFIPSDLIPAYESVSADVIAASSELLKDYQSEDDIRLHGDCHGGNILWRDDTAHFVDLDDCCSGPAIQDLWMFLSGERDRKEAQLSEVLAGYEEFMSFEAFELNWIEALRASRLMHHAGWIGRRWEDPAFPRAFPWFGQPRFWSDHILALREQLSNLQEPTLRWL